MSGDIVAETLSRLPDLVNGQTDLIRRGRFMNAEFLVEADTVPIHLVVEHGRITEIARGPFRMRSWRFAIRAEAQAWLRFWEPFPEPGFHDIIAMSRMGVARLEGDLQPLMANLRYVKEVLEMPRASRPGSP